MGSEMCIRDRSSACQFLRTAYQVWPLETDQAFDQSQLAATVLGRSACCRDCEIADCAPDEWFVLVMDRGRLPRGRTWRFLCQRLAFFGQKGRVENLVPARRQHSEDDFLVRRANSFDRQLNLKILFRSHSREPDSNRWLLEIGLRSMVNRTRTRLKPVNRQRPKFFQRQ